jgi:hypothetical protein
MLSWPKLLTDVFQEEEETQLFAEFHYLSSLLSNLNEKDHDYRSRRAFLLKFLDILKELKLLKEVKDILDEIKMIESVLEDQRRVLTSFERVDQFLRESQQVKLQELVWRTERSFRSMKERTEAVEKGVSCITPSVLATPHLLIRRRLYAFSISSRSKPMHGRPVFRVKGPKKLPAKATYVSSASPRAPPICSQCLS